MYIQLNKEHIWCEDMMKHLRIATSKGSLLPLSDDHRQSVYSDALGEMPERLHNILREKILVHNVKDVLIRSRIDRGEQPHETHGRGQGLLSKELKARKARALTCDDAPVGTSAALKKGVSTLF